MKKYSYEKHGKDNWFYTIVNGDEWKRYTKFYSGAIEVTTCSGGYVNSTWIKK